VKRIVERKRVELARRLPQRISMLESYRELIKELLLKDPVVAGQQPNE